MNIKNMTYTALMAAVICILAPLSIQIGPIPISFTNLALYFAVYVIGTKRATYSYTIYYLLGLVGLPVFSGFTGGIGKAVGPTGGCLIGFFFMTIISGIFVSKFKDNKIMQMIGMIIGTIVVYTLAVLWFCFVMKTSLLEGLMACVAPFIVIDLIKMVLAMYVGTAIRKRLNM